jgi:eukaryotic-like serine/threonine-protein kinase
MLYRFNQFEVDDREFRLTDGKTSVPLEPKVLRLLIYLIENRNQLVRKQELLDAVWQDAVVTENALTRAVGLLRKALNDDIRVPKFIETVPTVGYRFIAKVIVLDQNPGIESSSRIELAPPSPTQQVGSRRYSVWIPVVVLLLLATAAGAYRFFFHRRSILTEKDTIVLADFDNSTGDPVFDTTLRRGMAVQLDQSPFLSLIQDDRIQQTLREMGQPADTRLTPPVAREICVRTESAAVLDGSIAPLGSQYVIDLRARDCQSGKVLAEEQVQAARKEDVLNALDRIAGRFRTRLGESLSSVEKYDTPLAEVTTSSLEALKAFSLGQKMESEGLQSGALPFYSKAVELDPNFAVAYSAMAVLYAHTQQPDHAAEMIRKAYALRDKVSERERFWIEINYYWYGTGELEKAVSSLEIYEQTYPRNADSYVALGTIDRWLGNFDKALEESRGAYRLTKDDLQNLAADYINLNRFDEAEAAYKEAEDRKSPFEGRAKSRYLLAFLKGDSALMSQLAASARGQRGEDAMLGAQADTEAWHGRMRSARQLTRQAIDSAVNAGALEVAAGQQAWEALFEADLGNREQSRAGAGAALKLAPNRDVQEMAALAMARTGDTAAAEKLAATLDKAFPLDTLVQKNWLPVIRAAIALRRNDPAGAVELLQATSPIELARSAEVGSPSLRPVYLRGEAYLMLHDGNRAAAEFQKFIDHRGLVRNSPWGPLARLGLARAYALQGDTVKARAAYQQFLTTWKDADPDIPILIQAKAEYAKL